MARRGSVRTLPFRSPALDTLSLSSKDDCWAEFRRAFKSSVGSAIASDHEVIAELSGGLDSSSIVCVADELVAAEPSLNPGITAAAGVYPGLDCDETPFIDAVAAHVRVPVEKWNATVSSLNELEQSSIPAPGSRTLTFAGVDGQLRMAGERQARVLVSGLCGDQIGAASGQIRDAITDLRWLDALEMMLNRPDASPKTVSGALGSVARLFVPLAARRAYRKHRSGGARPEWLSDWAKRFRRSSPPYRPPTASVGVASQHLDGPDHRSPVSAHVLCAVPGAASGDRSTLSLPRRGSRLCGVIDSRSILAATVAIREASQGDTRAVASAHRRGAQE